jgi:hypothetical protein
MEGHFQHAWVNPMRNFLIMAHLCKPDITLQVFAQLLKENEKIFKTIEIDLLTRMWILQCCQPHQPTILPYKPKFEQKRLIGDFFHNFLLKEPIESAY